MTTIDITQKPSWFDVIEPEERKYWMAGSSKTNGLAPGRIWDGTFAVFTSERAAFIWREVRTREGQEYTSLPFECTREECLERARERGAHTVRVRDETLCLVEEWTVNQ